MPFEKPVEVLDPFVAKDRCDGDDLGRWKDAEQPAGKRQADFQLEFGHRLVVRIGKVPLKRSHLHAKFSCQSTDS